MKKNAETHRFIARMAALQGALAALFVLSLLLGREAEVPSAPELTPAEPRLERLAAPVAESGAQAAARAEPAALPVPIARPEPLALPEPRFARLWPELPPRGGRRSPLVFDALIRESARRQRLDPALVFAVTAAESAFDPGALSPKGARGLMQVMPATARRFGVDPEALFQPGPNLEAGTRYLRWLEELYEGRLPLMLAAYNAGERAVESYGGVPPYPETRQYLRRIYRFLGRPTAEIVLYETPAHETPGRHR